MKKQLNFLIILFVAFAVLGGIAFWILPLPGQVPILMYHFVGTRDNARASKNFVARESFEKQMQFLRNFGYHVISIDELYEIKTGKRKPRGREIAITFDDGNVSIATEVMPILKRYEYPIMLFLITEALRAETFGSMSIATAQELLKNPWVSIGSHTRTHPILSQLNEDQMRNEIAKSKVELEEIFKRPILYLAYPSGDFNPLIGKVTQKAGYRLAFTTSPKKLKTSDTGPFAMTRVKISRSSDNPFIFWFKISGIYEIFKRTRHQVPQLSFLEDM